MRTRAPGRSAYGARFSLDHTRFCLPVDSRIACYRGAFDGHGKWHGNIVGVTLSKVDAARFLDGAEVPLIPANA